MDRTGDVVPVREVVPGDMVTETTTPDGPWYVVLATHAAAGVLVVDAGDGLRVDVQVGDPGSVVLRRTR